MRAKPSSTVVRTLKNGFAQTVSDGWGTKIFFALPIFLNHVSDDPDHVAAYGLILTTLNFLYVPFVAPLFGETPNIAQWFGELHHDNTAEEQKEILRGKIRSVFQLGCAYIAFIAAPAAVIPSIYSGSLLSLIGQNEKSAQIAGYFLRIFSNTIPAEFLAFFSMQFLLANRNTKTLWLGGVFVALGLLSTIALSFGLRNLPKYDTDGILISYSASAWATTFLYAGTLFIHRDFKELGLAKYLFNSLKGKTGEFLKFLKSSTVPMITIVSEFGLGFFVIAMSIYFGVDAQAALTLAIQCLSLNNLLNISFAIGGLILMGGEIGADPISITDDRKNQLLSIGKIIVSVGTLVESILPILLIAQPNWIINLISPKCTQIVREKAETLIIPIALYSVLAGTVSQLLFQTRLFNRGLFSAVVLAGCLTAGALIGCLLAFAFKMEVQGLAIGLTASMLLSLIALIPIWANGINNINQPVHKTEYSVKFKEFVRHGLDFLRGNNAHARTGESVSLLNSGNVV